MSNAYIDGALHLRIICVPSRKQGSFAGLLQAKFHAMTPGLGQVPHKLQITGAPHAKFAFKSGLPTLLEWLPIKVGPRSALG